METLNIIIATILVYSAVATAAYIATNENDDVICAFGLGIVGLTLSGVMEIIRKVIFQFKYRIGKRSIFVEEATNKNYKCNPKYADDINGWNSGYRLVKRYAPKSEYKNIPDFSKEFIEKALRNCDHCKYDKECECTPPYNRIKCKHNEYGQVLEFDKFEEVQKTLWKQC